VFEPAVFDDKHRMLNRIDLHKTRLQNNPNYDDIDPRVNYNYLVFQDEIHILKVVNNNYLKHLPH